MWNNHCEISFPALSAALAALGFFSPSLGLSQKGKNRASIVGRSLGMTPADTLTGSDSTAIAIKAATKNAL